MSGCIDPVPFIEPREYETEQDRSMGYIALIVPQSAEAPHQVTVGGDYRFYGRGGQGNRVLTAGDVERLHERRQRWRVNHQARLAEVIEHAPFPPKDRLGYLHTFCQPVPPDRALWARATRSGQGALLDALQAAARSITVGQGGHPALSSGYNRWERHGADAWTLAYSPPPEPEPDSYASCDLATDGRAQLFMGRAADVVQRHANDVRPPFLILETLIAGNLASFLAIMGTLFRAAGYVSQVDLGLAITGIRVGSPPVASMRTSTSSPHGFRPTRTPATRKAPRRN